MKAKRCKEVLVQRGAIGSKPKRLRCLYSGSHPVHRVEWEVVRQEGRSIWYTEWPNKNWRAKK